MTSWLDGAKAGDIAGEVVGGGTWFSESRDAGTGRIEIRVWIYDYSGSARSSRLVNGSEVREMEFQFARRTQKAFRRDKPAIPAKTVQPPPTVSAIHQLQKSVGNQRVLRMLNSRRTDPSGDQDIADSVNRVTRSTAKRLDEGDRVFMERRIGYDFSNVRIHADGPAARSASDLGARAYTVGNDIVFGAGEYQPGAERYRRLLAHELTHVVQQARRAPGRQDKMKVGPENDTLEREADAVADAVMTQRIAGLPAEDVPEDKHMLAQPMTFASASVGRRVELTAVEPRIQRTANFVSGRVHATRNFALQLATGRGAGETKILLNGHDMLSVSARPAVNWPTLADRRIGGGIEAWVSAVATNVGSFDEAVLNSGPWSTVTTKGNVGTKLGLASCTGGGACTLTANGQPNDGAVAASNRTHEDRHAADYRVAFNAAFGTWDTRVTAAYTAGRKFTGPTVAAAQAALWTHMGGTPARVAITYRTDSLARGTAFHRTAAGGPLVAFNPRAGAGCGTANVKVR